MKTLILLIYLVSISIGAIEQHPVVKVAQNNVYFVQIQDMGENPMGSGSGFAISSTRLVTNHHVADAGDFLFVYNYMGTKLGEMTVVFASEEADVAILEFDSPYTRFPSYLPMYEGEEIPHFTEVFGAGYPLGDGLEIHKGTYQKQSRLVATHFRVDMSLAPGMSGSPLLVLDDDGVYKVIGINSAVVSLGSMVLSTFALFVHIDEVKKLIE